MRILCSSYEYPPVGGGGATVCQRIAETFAAQGHHYDVITSRMKGLPAYERRNGVNIYRVPCIRRHLHSSTTAELASQLVPAYYKALELHRRHHYHIHHTHFIVPSGIVARQVKQQTGLPYVLTAHGSDVPGYNAERFGLAHRLIAPLWRRVIADSDALTVPSEFLRDLIWRQTSVPQELIPNGFDAPASARTERRNRILVVSRLVERKGIQFLLSALKDMEAPWECWIAGDGPYRRTLERLAAEVKSPVRFLGMVPRQELGALYRSAKIFVLPSSTENFPLVLLEAMHAGCAVVTTAGTGCAEVVGDAAVTFEPGNVEALRTALTALMENETSVTRLSDLGQRRAAFFSTERVTDEYRRLFERIIDRSGRPTVTADAQLERGQTVSNVSEPP